MEKDVKVAIDISPLESGHWHRGIGVHTRELIQALKEINISDLKVEFVNFLTSDLSKYDLVHYQSFHPYFLSLPLRKFTKSIITIHDVIYLLYPKRYIPGIRGKIKLSIQKQLLKRVDGIITISKVSKSDIVRLLKINKSLVHVIHIAQPDVFSKVEDNKVLQKIKAKYKLPEGFVLYVGDVNYNKNIPGLVKGCIKSNRPLVIIGKNAKNIDTLNLNINHIKGPKDWLRYLTNKPHPEVAHYKELTNLLVNPNILRLGYVDYEDYKAIMSMANVYCQVSFYEGFGIPILEAFVAGVPVVASDIPIFKEIAKDSCLFVDPDNPDDIAEKINTLFNEREVRNKLIKKGYEQSKKFSWEKTATKTLDVYRKVLGLD